jgi:hypothetical protein
MTRASWPWSAVSWRPSGKADPTGIGIVMAGVPSAVYGELSRESPVVVRPSGAGPGAAGVKITGAA